MAKCTRALISFVAAIMVMLSSVCLPAQARDYYQNGGPVALLGPMVTDAKMRGESVEMPAGSRWYSAATMWLGAGNVWVSPEAVFFFHEGQKCPDVKGVTPQQAVVGAASVAGIYGLPGCRRNAYLTEYMRSFVPPCVRRLGDYWRVWSKPGFTPFLGKAILGMCAGDPTVHALP